VRETILQVRAAADPDLEALTRIYNHYVVRSVTTFDVEPVSMEERRLWLQQFGTGGPHRLFVAEGEAGVLGFASSTPYRPKAAYQSSVETSVYVHPEHLGRRIGLALYRALLEALEQEPVHRAYAAIALPNPASISLHERFGFVPVGTFTEVGIKDGRFWSVRWFEKRFAY